MDTDIESHIHGKIVNTGQNGIKTEKMCKPTTKHKSDNLKCWQTSWLPETFRNANLPLPEYGRLELRRRRESSLDGLLSPLLLPTVAFELISKNIFFHTAYTWESSKSLFVMCSTERTFPCAFIGKQGEIDIMRGLWLQSIQCILSQNLKNDFFPTVREKPSLWKWLTL